MRLRYYLRGLGLGLLIATVVLTVANADRHPLSDAEIRARAAELGMVDSESIKLPAQDKTNPPKEEPDKEESESLKEDASPKADEPPKTEPAEKEMPEAEPVKEEEPEEKATAASASVTFVIRSGSNSYSVSKDLAAAGLVENAEEYDNYLCNNGYSGSIRAGTYEIVPGTSGEEIARMIAR